MSEYQIVFEGKLSGERPLDEVKRNLAALFKMKSEQVDALFTGKAVVIKRDIDQATAVKYQAAFKKAGALCSIVGATAEPPVTAAAKPRPAATTSSGGSTNAKDRGGRMAGKDIVHIAVPQNLSGLSIAEAGAPLETLSIEENISIPDTSGLSFSQDDATYLAPMKKSVEAKVDISGLTLEKPE